MILSTLLAAGSNPMEHVVDKPHLTTDTGAHLLTMNMITMVVVLSLLVWTLSAAAKAIGTGAAAEGNERFVTKGRFSQMIEVVVIYLRDNIVRPQLGRDADRFLPFLLTLFFFILYNNVLGLVPLVDLQELIATATGVHFTPIIGGTATANIAVTAALALVAFVVIQINGLRSSGLKGWAAHFLGGAPLYLAPIMIPVEIMGTFIKPFALAVRLFANMTAGHTLLATLLMFTGMGVSALGFAAGSPITLASILAAIPLMFLELFVAFLQAFIFMFLTTVFIAQLMHHHHDEHAHAEQYDEEHPAEADMAAPVSQY